MLVADRRREQSVAIGRLGIKRPTGRARISIMGRATRLARGEDAAEREVFLDRHPSAAMYADFDDFAFFRVQIEEGHLVAGFGRIETVLVDEL